MKRRIHAGCRAVLALAFLAGAGCSGSGGGSKEGPPEPVPPTERTVVKFGDTHVHTRYSLDAFMYMYGEDVLDGEHDITEACDFARYCADLDFIASTEHSEYITDDLWGRIKNEVQACNDEPAVIQGHEDFIAYTGWEWTQSASDDPEQGSTESWGHKNVFFVGYGEDDVPDRVITSAAFNLAEGAGPPESFHLPDIARARLLDRAGLTQADAEVLDEYLEIPTMLSCPDISSPAIYTSANPDYAPGYQCLETAFTPGELFGKLDEWGLPTIVGAHGTAWAVGPANLAAQVNRQEHDPDYQRFVEVFSKHGNSEEYRSWAEPRAWVDPTRGDASCVDDPSNPDDTCDFLCMPPPADQIYLPCCWRRVQLVLEREICRRPGGGQQSYPGETPACRAAVLDARGEGNLFYASPANETEDWLACNQCPDCWLPALTYQTQGAIQLGLTYADRSQGDVFALDVGFLSSMDTHFSEAGSTMEAKGYAPLINTALTHAMFEAEDPENPNFEDSFSNLYTGGIAAVHVPSSQTATRETIFEALRRREIYAVSGPRILLWFYLTNPDGGGELPMGSVVQSFGRAPAFRVHAVGAFPEDPDLPCCTAERPCEGQDETVRDLCTYGCYAPMTDQDRLKILRFEIVRVRRQTTAGQDPTTLIEDPWRVVTCEGDEASAPAGRAECWASFTDPDYPAAVGEVAYYVRAIQEETLVVNGDPHRCLRDADGRCIASDPCRADDPTDDCKSPTNERAWSSPIYLYPPRS